MAKNVLIKLKKETDEQVKLQKKQQEEIVKKLKTKEAMLIKNSEMEKDVKERFKTLKLKLEQAELKLA